MNNILLVSSGQPSANPRLVKEVSALVNEGYQVKVLYCPLSPWADEYDKILFKKYNNVEWIKVGFHPKNDRFKYLLARARQKIYKLVYKVFGDFKDTAIKSMVLFSQELTKVALKHKADVYIGHNLGALPAVIKAAKLRGAKASFDFEDFHRGEGKANEVPWVKTMQIENKYIPFLHSATAASPLINAAYKNLYPSLIIETINNCFPLKYAVSEIKLMPTNPLKLFWFSQTIGKNRGLETVIQAMAKINTTEFTILGYHTDSIKNYFLNYAKEYKVDPQRLHFLLPVDESEITSFASQHHIGLSTDIPITNNRDICLTNKIFMYMLAGNAIILTKTKAHKLLIKENPGFGYLFNWTDDQELSEIFLNYQNTKNKLDDDRNTSFLLGKNVFNWDIEKIKLINNIKTILQIN